MWRCIVVLWMKCYNLSCLMFSIIKLYFILISICCSTFHLQVFKHFIVVEIINNHLCLDHIWSLLVLLRKYTDVRISEVQHITNNTQYSTLRHKRHIDYYESRNHDTIIRNRDTAARWPSSKPTSNNININIIISNNIINHQHHYNTPWWTPPIFQTQFPHFLSFSLLLRALIILVDPSDVQLLHSIVNYIQWFEI